MMPAREKVKAALGSIGLLEPARAALHRINAARRRRYYASVVQQYRSPFARPMESFSAYQQRERDGSERAALARFEADRAAILAFARERFGAPGLDGLPAACAAARSGEQRAALAGAILDQVTRGELTPRFYDYDYVDDVLGIVRGRYCGDQGCNLAASRAILDALCLLASGDGRLGEEELPAALRRLLGRGRHVPPRGDVARHVHDVIPEMADEFISLKAESNLERFLEINLEYSRRQALQLGLWDNRDLSLLRGYERDHHLLLRTLLELIAGGQVSRDDEILLVGPRHIDEVVFFRKTLGLPGTIGLDLFPYGRGEIVAGDMHRMPFEAGRFRLVYSCNTLSYSYDVRRVIEEMARVTQRPGYVFLIDSGARSAGPDALGRSDVGNIDGMIGLFHRHRYRVLAKDAGRSLALQHYANQPCLAVRLDA